MPSSPTPTTTARRRSWSPPWPTSPTDLDDLRPAPPVDVPSPEELTLEHVVLPRDAFFGPTEQVPIAEAEGRITAEMLTPYPPGIPAALPGERLNRQVLEYLRTGVEAGMVVPDAADQQVGSIRVAIEK
ncbi:hypothetical protein [Actinacidiphila glaucinigra]|uniref:Orn/Lys/Arg family decarboxylase n=1 Tax=Actinacidiphila glaucinigra TaxID=235986 RepID=UPI0036EBCBE4